MTYQPLALTGGEKFTTLAPPGQPEGTQLSRLTEALNKEEPFAVRFSEDGENVILSLPNAVHLLQWIRKYHQDVETRRNRLPRLP